MKVIDLLNKIANGEEVPNKIKWNDFIYEKSKYNATPMGYYHRTSSGGFKLWFLNEINDLNDEIEIIEEDKKIKRIQSCGDNLYSEYTGQWLVNKENYTEYDELLMNKINEIIDKLNKGE